DDALRIEVGGRPDAVVLADLDAGLRGCEREAADESRRLEHGVFGMLDGRREAVGEGRLELFEPIGGEAVGPARVGLGAELGSLLFVRGEAERARAPEGVAGVLLEAVESLLRQTPEASRRVTAHLRDGEVVGRCAAAEGEAAVPAACAAR